MNRFFIPFLVAVLFAAASCSQKNEIVIEHPPYVVRSSNNAEIDKILLNDTATVLYITEYTSSNSSFRYSAETYIQANDLKYTVLKADGIELDKWTSDSTGKVSFTLTFPPIPRETKQIDFIENDRQSQLKIWGIELKSKTLTNRIPVPKELAEFKVDTTDKTSLQAPVFKDTVAIIKGRMLGYRPELSREVKVSLTNPLSGDFLPEQYFALIKDDGSFSISVPVFCTTEVTFTAWQVWIENLFITPGEETVVYIDLQQWGQTDRRRDGKVKGLRNRVFFGGANASINKQLYEIVFADSSKFRLGTNEQ
jgi:hypothetical protein